MATYNGEKYISEQIQSIIGQSYTDWSLFIHDDGSTDGTNAVIDEWICRYPEKIFRIDGPSQGGARNNFFYLMREVEADYYMCCDQDDVWLKDKIRMSFNELCDAVDDKMLEGVTKEIPILGFSDLKVVDDNLNTISESMNKSQNLNGHKLSLERLLIQNVVTGCTMIFNKALRDKMLLCKNIGNVKMHDWWAALVAVTFGKIIYIDQPTILYRQHSDNSVGALDDTSVAVNVERVRNRESMRLSLEITRIQAKELSETFNLPVEHIVSRYANCMEMNKLKRLVFYYKNDIVKTGITRKIGQLVLG